MTGSSVGHVNAISAVALARGNNCWERNLPTLLLLLLGPLRVKGNNSVNEDQLQYLSEGLEDDERLFKGRKKHFHPRLRLYPDAFQQLYLQMMLLTGYGKWPLATRPHVRRVFALYGLTLVTDLVQGFKYGEKTLYHGVYGAVFYEVHLHALAAYASYLGDLSTAFRSSKQKGRSTRSSL
ncbi:hypothetical protein FIBSPDRAFT_894585 [Athelia psychrophila]|uniref:Uncharacterized protein n=1 Tax=Athelia psychrophila TaxID=1759441 RepID=A0A166FNM3_9AGAM|nr:hypothetical protein FIBSPDRAFT_894585 [Fibularhizoctonia sp. CBS 109695]